MGLHWTKKVYRWEKISTKNVSDGMGEIITNYVSDKRLIFKIYKELIQLNNNKNNLIKNGQRPE